jgi:hypothetical protein
MLDLDPGLPFRIDSLLGLPAESGSVLRLDPDTGTYLWRDQDKSLFFAKGSRYRFRTFFTKGSRCRYVFCEGIRIQVRFLWRDPDVGTSFAKGSRCRYVFCEGIQIQVRFCEWIHVFWHGIHPGDWGWVGKIRGMDMANRSRLSP